MARDVTARIPVTPDTAKRLNQLKAGGESYDALIRRIIVQGTDVVVKPFWELSDEQKAFINGGEKLEDRIERS